MNFIGRRIYFEKTTGNIILDKGEMCGSVVKTTIEQDFESFTTLQERVRETVGIIELEYGQFAQDFSQCTGYKINPETLQLEFSYPDPTKPIEGEQPVYQKPLTEQVKELEARQIETENAILALMDMQLA